MGLLHRLVNNFGMKLMSLVLALLLSVYVVRYVNPEIPLTLYLPLKVRNLAAELIITDPDPFPGLIQIKVRGPYSSVQQLQTISHIAVVDCSDYSEPGDATLPVQIPDFGTVQVVYQDRNFIDVYLEKSATLEKQLAVDRLGEVNSNYDIGSERLSRTSVVITGPETVVGRIALAQVEPSIDGLQEDLSIMLPVRLYDENHVPVEGPALTLEPRDVNYQLELVPIGSVKVLTVYPVFEGSPPEGYVLYNSTSKPLYIPADADLVPDGEFVVRTGPIDLSNHNGSFTETVELEYPFDPPRISKLPITCEVSVEIIPIEEAGAVIVQVQLTGKRPEYEYIVTPQDLLVKSEELQQLDEAAVARIEAKLYVGDLQPGEHRLAPQLILPLTLDRARIDPATITVTIIQRQE